MIGDHLTIFDRDHILVLYKIDTPALSLLLLHYYYYTTTNYYYYY
jgi:hypothetical protein